MYLFLMKMEARPSTLDLVRKCLVQYNEAKGLGLNPEILRKTPIAKTNQGKPFFSNYPDIHFSVSHSGSVWGCAIDESPVGFDLEDLTYRNRGQVPWENSIHERIAKRYFNIDESLWMMTKETKDFFRLWSRKEAYGKYLGSGLTKEILRISMIQNDRLIDSLNESLFLEPELSQTLVAVCCGGDGLTIEQMIGEGI